MHIVREEVFVNFSEMINIIKKKFYDERIGKSKDRLLKVWNLEIPEDRIPFVFWKIPDNSGTNDDKIYEADYDIEDFLYYQLHQIINRSELEDDYIPSLWPGLRQSAIPSAFGAVEEKHNNHYWCMPIIKKPEDVYNLKEPNFNIRGTPSWRILENIKYFKKITKGEIPIHMTDMQGPMACASSMWDVNSYLLAMHTNPKEVHYLHKILTRAFIKFVDLQIEAAEGDFITSHLMPFSWIPREKGITLSNDLLALVGPDQVYEFSNPYDNEISNRYGGIIIHSCGKFDHNLNALKGVENLSALDFGVTETDVTDVINVYGNSILYNLHCTEISCPPQKPMTQESYVKMIAKIIKEYKISAQVLIFNHDSSGYTYDQTLELNKLALNMFKYE